jgi:hypothetical protein
MAERAAEHNAVGETSVPVGDVATSMSSAGLAPLHDVTHQVRLIREALQSEKRRLGFFLGAGCPLGIFDKTEKESLKHIPDVSGLTISIGSSLTGTDVQTAWTKLTAACTSANVTSPNVEHMLTQLRTICALKGTALVDGMSASDLRVLDDRICELISKTVGKPLPEHRTSYDRFAAWIGHVERTSPVEVFTPNYDLLFEEAFERFNVPFFDGFVGSREPFFDLAAMEQDLIPTRWARLWKLHGSINWIRRHDDSVFRSHPATPSQRLLIYPSHLKYDQSRRMPYLAMIDRLRAFFRDANSVIVICGYSFADDHLNEVLLDGLRGNRSAHCFALMYPRLCACSTLVAYAMKHPNLSVLSRDGAVIGMLPGGYKAVERSTVVSGAGFGATTLDTGKQGGNSGAGLCHLGDFHHFALFLERQFGVTTSDQPTEAR